MEFRFDSLVQSNTMSWSTAGRRLEGSPGFARMADDLIDRSRAISELGMTNVPRAELRTRAGGRRRVNSIRGRLKGFWDVSRET